MQQPGLDTRHRDKNGEISRKHGNAQVKTLRRIYGLHFAEGFPAEATLRDVLDALHEDSLHQLVRHHEDGSLQERIEEAEKPV